MNHTWSNLGFCIIGALIIMVPALYNGYPLVFSDTGTYIESGMSLVVPQDRPIGYGLFIRMTSWGWSLWPVVFFQSLMAQYVLWKLGQTCLPQLNRWLHLMIVFILVGATGLGWYCGQIMPDIFLFTGIGALTVLLFKQKQNWGEKISLAVILGISILVHHSHGIIALLLLMTVWGLWLPRGSKRWVLPVGVVSGALLCMALLAYVVGGQFRLGQGGHVFFTGRLLDSGILKQYLEENCSDDTYALCAFKDDLPEDSRKFLWDAGSPMYQHGGWQGSEKEYKHMIRDIVFTPKYTLLLTASCLSSTLVQLTQNNVGSGLVSTYYRDPESPPYQQVQKHFPLEFKAYLQSRQNKNLWYQELDLEGVNHIFHIVLFVSILILLYFLGYSYRKMHFEGLSSVFYTLMAAVFLNAFVVASLANVYDRLQGRISWVVVWCALMLVLQIGGGVLGEDNFLKTKEQE